MSYATAPTFEGTRLGIRRLGVLSGICGEVSTLGDTAGTVDTLVSLGMLDRGTANYLVSKGATDYQLIALLNGQTDLVTLMNQLQGTLAPYNPASPANPVMNATISTAYGVYDLSQQAAWDAINSLFASTQQKLTALARRLPSDPDVLSHVADFNSKVMQWAGYYQQAFGSAPSPIPTVTLSGLGIAPVVAGVLVAGVLLLVAFLYEFNKWIDGRNAQIAATTQQAQTQASLVAQYQAAVASGNTGAASQLLSAINSINSSGGIGSLGPAASGAWNWVQQNWGLVAVALLGTVVILRRK